MSSSVKNDVTILVCCHKKDFCHTGEGFYPIHVGKALHPELDLGIPGDDTGDNISIKNPNYCELTAHYWLWKNGPKTKYVGLNHYRRYFDFGSKTAWWIPRRNLSESEVRTSQLSLPDLDIIFRDYDIILARKDVYPQSLADDYRRCHVSEDLHILEDVVRVYYSDYYDSFKHIMYRTNKLSHYNMFITNGKLFDEYSSWLFGVLAKVEERVKISPYPYQARVFGFMAERLLNVYVHKHALRVKYLPILWITDDEPVSSSSFFKMMLKYNCSWYAAMEYHNNE